MEKGVPIRSISRGIAVLAAINRHRSLTMMEIARESGVPYPTACRILQTLLHEGLVEREPSRKRYRPTLMVRTLSCGFQETDLLVTTAREPIVELGKKAVWPISLCTRVGMNMMVRDSTHALSPLTFQNYYAGYTLPILECASGKAYLAFMDADERAMVLDALGEQEEGPPVDPASLQVARSGGVFEEIRARGFAVHGRNKHTATPGKTSSIAAPIFDGDKVAASLALVFFAASMTIQQAIDGFAPQLKETADEISRRLTAARAAEAPVGERATTPAPRRSPAFEQGAEA
jgi:IclR family mhp operon transcriptional activator